MSIRSQLLKGILDGCVLAVIEKEPVYGYILSKKLQQLGLQEISEGTLYPVLLRLQRTAGSMERCSHPILGRAANIMN